MKFAHRYFLVIIAVLSGCDSGQQFGDVAAATKNETTHVHGVGNATAGRAIAKQCAECHGLDGVQARSGAPFIAGVTQDYLVSSMLAYAKDSRKHDDMKRVVSALTPEEIANVSAYYTSLTPEWRGAVAREVAKAIREDKRAYVTGEKLAASCNSCHGREGNSAADTLTPTIAGMPLEYFVPALKSYINGERQHGIMSVFNASLTDEDIYNLGVYYVAQNPKRVKLPNAGDPVEGKRAAKRCAGCHGFDGNSLNPYMPSLAGQPMKYLVKAIKDYRDGQRQEVLMQGLVDTLDDHAILNIAAYFAAQQPESALHRAASPDKKFDPEADGEKLANACKGCHGTHGNSRKAGVPNLTGVHPKYMMSVAQVYYHGQRKSDAMQSLMSFLSDTDLEKLGFYYASQKPEQFKQPMLGDPLLGEKLSSECTVCHGKGGISANPETTPSLAGQDEKYIVAATKAYASGERKHDSMKSAARGLTDDDLKNLAAYFASQVSQMIDIALPEDPAIVITQRCSRCHGEGGYSTQAGVPRLAGQLEPYLVVALREYQDGTRKSKTMHAMADVLSLVQIKAIAAYYAQQ